MQHFINTPLQHTVSATAVVGLSGNQDSGGGTRVILGVST